MGSNLKKMNAYETNMIFKTQPSPMQESYGITQVKASPKYNLNIDSGPLQFVTRDSLVSGSPERLNKSINGNSPRDPIVPQTPVGLGKEGLPDILTRRR